MSPQGLQAQALVKKVKGYDPKRDTRNKSLLKFYKKQKDELLRSGAMPENERSFFNKQFSGMFSGATANDNALTIQRKVARKTVKRSPRLQLRTARMAA